MTPPIPPHHPEQHLMHERTRRETAEREGRSGRHKLRLRGLSTGDIIIFLVLGIAVLPGCGCSYHGCRLYRDTL
jgi:hypothetical protein